MSIITKISLGLPNQYTVILYSLTLPDAKDLCLKLVLYMKNSTRRNTSATMDRFRATSAQLGQLWIPLLTQGWNSQYILEEN